MNQSERLDFSRFTAPIVASGVTKRVGTLTEFAELLQGERGTEKVFENFLGTDRLDLKLLHDYIQN